MVLTSNKQLRHPFRMVFLGQINYSMSSNRNYVSLMSIIIRYLSLCFRQFRDLSSLWNTHTFLFSAYITFPLGTCCWDYVKPPVRVCLYSYLVLKPDISVKTITWHGCYILRMKYLIMQCVCVPLYVIEVFTNNTFRQCSGYNNNICGNVEHDLKQMNKVSNKSGLFKQ